MARESEKANLKTTYFHGLNQQVLFLVAISTIPECNFQVEAFHLKWFNYEINRPARLQGNGGPEFYFVRNFL